MRFTQVLQQKIQKEEGYESALITAAAPEIMRGLTVIPGEHWAASQFGIWPLGCLVASVLL